MSIDFCFTNGFAVGCMYADDDTCEEDGIVWGIAVMLGPITIFIEKERS